MLRMQIRIPRNVFKAPISVYKLSMILLKLFNNDKLILIIMMSVKGNQYQDNHERCLKNLQRKQNQFQKQKSLLEQKVQFLQQQLKEYQQREVGNKKLNQSIMMTYQQNQNLREQHINRSIKILTQKHQQQLRKIKQMHHKQTKSLQQTLSEYKDKYEKCQIEKDKKNVEFSKKVLEIKSKYENQIKKQLEQKQKQMQSKIEILTQKLKQAQSMAQLYKQFMQQRRQSNGQINDNYLRVRDFNISNADRDRDRRQSMYGNKSKTNLMHVSKQGHCQDYDTQNVNANRISRKSRIRDIEENNIKDMRRLSASRESVKHLTAKIDRAITQLKTSNSTKLHQRINQKLSKRL